MISKQMVLDLLKEFFEQGKIKIEVRNNMTFVVIDGDWIRVDVQ